MADALLTAQIRTVTYIVNFLKNTKEKKSPTMLTATYYEARVKLLERYFNEMFARNDELLPHAEELKESDYFVKNYFIIAENAYIDALADLNAEIERLRAPTVPPPTWNANERTRSTIACNRPR